MDHNCLSSEKGGHIWCAASLQSVSRLFKERCMYMYDACVVLSGAFVPSFIYQHLTERHTHLQQQNHYLIK